MVCSKTNKVTQGNQDFKYKISSQEMHSNFTVQSKQMYKTT